ncbi:MAG: hypothetical protein GXP31_03345 [Kiritimatiellaeota bacterium]|nr:hypothetical protein [Kiritimatiellota bacterium]
MDPVIAVIERSNQRGGRMFSVADLIAARTLTAGQAAWIAGCVLDGSSWLVGARPGGAGKTTVMSALLGLLPPPRRMYIANPGTGWERSGPGDCVVAYEIGAGPYDAYIWDRELRAFVRLARRGVRIVTNLHADTLEQARNQVVGQNDVSPEDFARFGLFLPIRLSQVGFSLRREIFEIYRSGPSGWGRVSREQAEDLADPAITDFLDAAVADGRREIRAFRARWLQFLDGAASAADRS